MPFEPGQSGNPAGRKKEQAFKTALTLALGEGKDPRAKLRKIAENLVTEAVKGEAWAIKEVADRMDGKPAQALQLSGDEDNPIIHKHESLDALESRIAGIAARGGKAKANGHANGSRRNGSAD